MPWKCPAQASTSSSRTQELVGDQGQGGFPEQGNHPFAVLFWQGLFYELHTQFCKAWDLFERFRQRPARVGVHAEGSVAVLA